MFRKTLFWMHLIAGCVAGVIILLMSATGVALTYERQILARADRFHSQRAVAPTESRLGVDQLVERIEQQQGGLPRNASLVLRSNPIEPAELTLGREGALYFDAYTGNRLGARDESTHGVFQKITAWHRWLGSEGEGRATARAITGACNFAFLFIVASGIYLWLPKVWSAHHLRPITWFKGGLSGKARDFNWHNVFGFWTAIPLLIVVASALPMSYTWANNLLYQITGSEIPAPNQAGRAEGRRAENPGARVSPGGRAQREQGSNRPELNSLWARAERHVPGWQSISLRLPERPNADLVFAIDAGDGGQPQKRSTLTLDAAGSVKKYESFSDLSAGRRLRSWSRFAHTGEYYGLVGQTIAGIASFAGVMLVWTGISLALRRLAAWRTRRARQGANALQPTTVA